MDGLSPQEKAADYIDFIDKYYLNYLYLSKQRQYRREQLHASLDRMISASESLRASLLMEEHVNRERSILRLQRVQLTIFDFNWLAKIGHGAFATVYLVTRKSDPSLYYALKHIKKNCLSNDNIVRIRTERTILAHSGSGRFVSLRFAFQDHDSLFLVMDFISGGSLSTLLDELGVMSEEAARFYFSEMVLSVNELHLKGYLHRDLKPDNFLIDIDGHLKLADFGLSKTFSNSQDNSGDIPQNLVFSVVGTPNYMAPELIDDVSQKKGSDLIFDHGRSLDAWSLGCILYELLAGVPPFEENVVGEGKIERPEGVSESCWNLLKCLLEVEPRKRIPMDQILRHDFFSSINVDNIHETCPPFVPKSFLKSPSDLAYFPDAVVLDGEPPKDVIQPVALEQDSTSPKVIHCHSVSVLPPTPMFSPVECFDLGSLSPVELCMDDLKIGPIPKTSVQKRPKSRVVRSLSTPRGNMPRRSFEDIAPTIESPSPVMSTRKRSRSEIHLAGFTFVPKD
ncbi:hypothetical protein GEMRC1_003081 [Eukaryota sp. GEM-RC1]